MKAVPLASILLSSGIAAAQPGAGPAASSPDTAPGDAAQAPGFVVIDGLDASSRAGLDITYLEPNLGNFSGDKPTLLRFGAHARYVDPASRFGGYVQVPFAYLSAKNGGGSSDTITDFGDLEAGVIFAPKLASPNVGLVLHAGLTAPTGETGFEAAAGTIVNSIALPTFYNSLPKAITAKLGVSPMLRSGNLFARLDLGLDWNFDAKDGDFGKGLHYNVGVGVDLGSAAIMLESENLTILSDKGGDSVTLNSIAVSSRIDAGAVSPYFAVVIPVEQDTSELIDFALTAGIDFKL